MGLYYLSTRYYDPSTMQFLTKDPADADGNQSSYQYCGGDPVGNVDPSGEWGVKVHLRLTFQWAWEVGIKPEYAQCIAIFDRSVDDWPTGWDKRRPSYTGKYHFAPLGAWGVGWYNASRAIWGGLGRWPSCWRMGRALHCFQDCVGHGRLVGMNHVLRRSWADEWDKAPSAYRRNTEAQTKYWLRLFRKAHRWSRG